MTDRTVAIDCRGLPAALAVLRIKQSLQGLSAQSGPLIARLSRDCPKESVAAGLRAASRVRLVFGEPAPKIPSAGTRKPSVAMSA